MPEIRAVYGWLDRPRSASHLSMTSREYECPSGFRRIHLMLQSDFPQPHARISVSRNPLWCSAAAEPTP
jgi:hypothetical protein